MRRFKNIKMLTVIMCMAIILSFTACSGQDSDGKQVGSDVEESDSGNNNSSKDVKEDGKGGEEGTATNGDDQDETGEKELPPIKILINTKSHYDFTDDDNYKSLYNGSYDLVYLTDDCKEAYPELSKALDDYNADREKSFLDNYKQYLSEAKELYENMTDDKDYFNGYTDDVHITLCRADDHYLSLSANASSYMGGAHGVYGSGGYNYDVKTGKKLILKDVIKDIPAFQNIVIQRLNDNYGDWIDSNLDEVVPECLTGEKDMACSWFITPRGVKVTFGIYLIASYAAGEQTVEITFNEHPELFSDDYKVSDGNYIEEYQGMDSYSIDIGNNGTIDNVGIDAKYNEYDEFESITINVNGVKTSIDAYGFSAKPSFIHKGDSVFLYLDVTEENDYSHMYAFKLEEGGALKIGEYFGYFTAGQLPDGDYESEWTSSWSSIPTTPDELYFGQRMQLLSTYDGIAKASINDMGELEIPEKYFFSEFYGNYGELTAKKDVKALVVDPDTREVTSTDALIKAGDAVSIIGTDGESFVDLKSADGKIYRVEVKDDEWPQTIDGTDIEELFDGVMFAG